MSGENSIVFIPGASNSLIPTEIQQRATDTQLFSGKQFLVSTFECLPETLLTTLQLAKHFRGQFYFPFLPSILFLPSFYSHHLLLLPIPSFIIHLFTIHSFCQSASTNKHSLNKVSFSSTDQLEHWSMQLPSIRTLG